jgi:hypothetical protein
MAQARPINPVPTMATLLMGISARERQLLQTLRALSLAGCIV